MLTIEDIKKLEAVDERYLEADQAFLDDILGNRMDTMMYHVENLKKITEEKMELLEDIKKRQQSELTAQDLIDKVKTIPNAEVEIEGDYLLFKIEISGEIHKITTPYIVPYYTEDYIEGYYNELADYLDKYIKDNQ